MADQQRRIDVIESSAPDPPERTEPAEPRPAEPRAAAPRQRRLVITAAVVVLLAATAFVAFRWGSRERPAAGGAPRPSASPSADVPLTVAQVFQTLAPSVVAIRSTPTNASGTGVVINGDGTILTALHVVQGAEAIEVTFADGTRSAATVAETAPAIDIATLSPATLPTVVVPAVLGGAGLAVGDDVVAIGNQLGLTGSTTAGVVSGLDRAIARSGGGSINGLIQFDAAVNPGSSGGPLVNTRGEIVGIVIALANPTDAGTFIGIGFAVPIGAAVAAGGGRQPQR
jgi:S1-C subfamily serine protease